MTLENVIEEIVGPIQDEFDAEKPELVDKGDGVYQVSGAMLVVDLEDELGLEFSDRDEDTIAGVVLSELGRRGPAGRPLRPRVELDLTASACCVSRCRGRTRHPQACRTGQSRTAGPGSAAARRP